MRFEEITDKDRETIVNEVRKAKNGMTILYRIKLCITQLMKSPVFRESALEHYGTLSPDIIILIWLKQDYHTNGTMGIATFLHRWKDVPIKNAK